jgi:hypothetical protein
MSKNSTRKGHHEPRSCQRFPARPLPACNGPRQSQPGERQGTASGGGSRPNEQYFGRQAQLEHEVELARRRYEAAQKRWNDLK